MQQNIKKNFQFSWMEYTGVVILTLSVVTFILTTKRIYAQEQDTRVQQITISLTKESDVPWNSYLNSRKKESRYIASKGGATFYVKTCSSANRIQEKNKVFFRSVTEAVSLGYTASNRC